MIEEKDERVIQISNISKSGTVHIPKQVLTKLSIEGKGRIVWIERGREIVVRKL